MIQRCHHSTARSVEAGEEWEEKKQDSLTFSGWQFVLVRAEMHSKLESKLNRPDLPQARSRLDLLTPRQKECAMRVVIPIQMSSISTRIGNKPASERALSGTDWEGGVFGLKKRTAGVCARKGK